LTAAVDQRPVLVTGATGPHGRAVTLALLSTGRRVRALTRDPTSARAGELTALGGELAVGDLLDPASLTEAMRGTSAVYAVTTPFGGGAQAEIAQGEQILAAADRAHVPWLVLASVASADRASGVPHFESKWQIEQRLASSQLLHTVVAPTYFYENLGNLDQKIADRELALPLPPHQPLQQIALADLGAAVASLFTRRMEFIGQRIELAGDQPTPQQMTDALSAAAARHLRYRQVPLDTIATRNADLAAMYRFLTDTGYQVDIAAVRAQFPDVNWTSFAQWVNATAPIGR